MNPGEFDTKVSIQTPSFAKVNGERVETFAEVESPWCKFEILKGREFDRAQQIAGECDVKFTTHHSSALDGIDHKAKIVIGSVAYDIQAAIPIPAGRPVYLEIFAKTRTTDASES